jgi:hypothetical protein
VYQGFGGDSWGKETTWKCSESATCDFRVVNGANRILVHWSGLTITVGSLVQWETQHRPTCWLQISDILLFLLYLYCTVCTISILSNICTLWYTIYDIYLLPHVSAPWYHPQAVTITTVYKPMCQYVLLHIIRMTKILKC